MAKVIFIAGLPGSGKSSYIIKNYPKDKYAVYDDYKCGATDLNFNSSLHFEKLMENLNNERDCVVADIDFCKAESRDEANRFIKEFSPATAIQWIFFENNPEACKQLLSYLHATTGKNIAEKSRMLDYYKELYKIPIGVYAERIWQPAKQ